MRIGLLAIFLPLMVVTQDDPPVPKLTKRYGFEANPRQFPQKTPQEGLSSVIKALENKSVDYLVAQLADPAYVDAAVAEYKKFFSKGQEEAKAFLAFDRLVGEVTNYYLEDPQLLPELRRFAKEGEWESMDTKASGTVKALPGRKVFLRKLENRWFFENRQQ